MRRLTVFILLVVFGHQFLAQKEITKPLWIKKRDANRIYKESNYIYLDSFACRSEKKVKDIKEEKISKLRQSLATHIYSNIENKETLDIYETTSNKNSTVNEQFSSNISMTSNVNLTQCDIESYFDKKNKKLYLLILQNKLKLKKSYKSSIETKLISLKGNLDQNFETKRPEEIIRLKSYLEKLSKEISNDITIYSLVSNISSDTQKNFPEELNKYKIKISNLDFIIQDKEFDKAFAEAEKLYNNRKCKESFKRSQDLHIKNTSDKRVKSLLSKSKDCWMEELLNKYYNLNPTKNYEECIKVLIQIINLSEKNKKQHYKDLKSKSFKNYINSKFQQIDNLILVDENKAEEIFSSINWYGEDSKPYISRYKKYESTIIDKITDKLILKFKKNLHDKEFKDAFEVIIELSEKNNDKDIKSLTTKLNTSWKKKVKKYDKKKLLKERPHLYCAKIGASFHSPQISFDQIKNSTSLINDIENNKNFLYPYYSFGLYRKFLINTKYSNSHRDKSSSYLVGIKFGWNDFNNKVNINKSSKELFTLNDSLNHEIQISSLLIRFINLNYGLIYNNIFSSSEYKYSSTVGIKIPISVFNFDFNVKYISDYKTENDFIVQAGLSLNLNFIKKYTKMDKNKVLLNLENYK